MMVLLYQSSFSNTGEFVDVNLSDDNYFDAPQIICSNINESTELSGDKSLRMDLTLSSTSETVSPVMDTDRMSITMVSSRINSPSDENTATLSIGDEHAATYITKIAELVNPSSSIKLIFAGYRPPNTFIKPLYRVLPTGSTDSIEDQGFTFFPTNDATVPDTTEALKNIKIMNMKFLDWFLVNIRLRLYLFLRTRHIPQLLKISEQLPW